MLLHCGSAITLCTQCCLNVLRWDRHSYGGSFPCNITLSGFDTGLASDEHPGECGTTGQTRLKSTPGEPKFSPWYWDHKGLGNLTLPWRLFPLCLVVIEMYAWSRHCFNGWICWFGAMHCASIEDVGVSTWWLVYEVTNDSVFDYVVLFKKEQWDAGGG